jgi:cell division protein FtsQ
MNPTDSVARFNRRRLVRRLTPFRKALVAVVVLGVVAACAWAVLFSPWLAANKVAVAGARTVSARQVEAAADVPVGTPLVRVDLARIRAAVAKLPAVDSVTVHRSWPHTIAIAITERQPVASLYHAGTWGVLDEHGVVFRETRDRSAAIPVVAVARSAGPEVLPDVARVAADLPQDLVSATRRITAATMDSITLRLKDGAVVNWGSAAESDRKVEVLRALLAHTKAGTYDVSVPGEPTTAK